MYQLASPAPQHRYVLGHLTPDDRKLLDWLIDESRPLSPEELEGWNRQRCFRKAVRLNRSDFEIYLTRDHARSDSGQALTKRLALEKIQYRVLSPADLATKLEPITNSPSSLVNVLETPGGLNNPLSGQEKAMDDYLMFIRSDYLLDRNTPIYSRFSYPISYDTTWMVSVREGTPERSEDRDEKFDYSAVRLTERFAGRIQRRCDCSGAHDRCPRRTNEGPQWRCVCGGPCKRSEACRKGMDRSGHSGYVRGNARTCPPWMREPPYVLPNDGDEAWGRMTSADFSSGWLAGARYGIGKQGAERSDDLKALKAWKEMWVSVESFSGDWAKE